MTDRGKLWARGVAVGVAFTAVHGCGGGNPPTPDEPAARWTVETPSVTLAEGPGADFFDIAGVLRQPDGRIVVADGGSSEIRFFAPDGRLLVSTGGRGPGPGEFTLIESMGPAGGDSVWVYDYGATRITVLTSDGTAFRTAPVTPPLSAGVMVGRRTDGSFILAQMWGSGDPAGPASEGLVRSPAFVVRYGSDGRLLDTLASVPGREVLQRMEGSRMVMGVAPFARSASHALLGDELVLGDQVDYRLEVLGPGQAPVREVRWEGPPLDLRNDEVEDWKEAQIASAAAPDRAAVRAYLAGTPIPRRRPAYGRLLPDADGCLWVAPYVPPDREARRWDVVSAAGRRLGAVEMPSRFRPLQIGVDWILGVARDDLDVERVELRPLARPSPSGC